MNHHEELLEKIRAHANEELPMELMGVSALNPAGAMASSVRTGMFSGYKITTVVTELAEPPLVMSGLEYKMGEGTIGVVVPYDCVVVERISPSARPYGGGAGVIIRRVGDDILDWIELPRTHQSPNTFTWAYVYLPNINERLRPGAILRAGERLAKSPALLADGTWAQGVRLNVAYVDIGHACEDGVAVSARANQKGAHRVKQIISEGYGANTLPRNLYGKDGRFQAFPLPGETVREDGLILALFDYSAKEAHWQLLPEVLATPDYMTDEIFRAKFAGMTVSDVSITPNPDKGGNISSLMSESVDAILGKQRQYTQRIIDITKNSGANLSPELHRMTVVALLNREAESNPRVRLNLKRKTLPPVTVTVTLEKTVSPSVAAKWSDSVGDKGVAVKIYEPGEEPMTEDGRSVDILIERSTIIRRMTPGGLWIVYLTSLNEGHLARLRAAIGIKADGIPLNILAKRVASRVDALLVENPDLLNETIKEYIDFMGIMYPQLKEVMLAASKAELIEYLKESLTEGVRTIYPANTGHDRVGAVKMAEDKFPGTYNRLSVLDRHGKRVLTNNKVRVANIPISLLDKAPSFMGSAIAVPPINVKGMPGSLSKSRRAAGPTRLASTRLGAAETAMLATHAGVELVAELLDNSSNPRTIEKTVRAIIESETPTNLERVIDRTLPDCEFAPTPNRLTDHMLSGMGIKIEFVE
jgi:hypothetical protein